MAYLPETLVAKSSLLVTAHEDRSREYKTLDIAIHSKVEALGWKFDQMAVIDLGSWLTASVKFNAEQQTPEFEKNTSRY